MYVLHKKESRNSRKQDMSCPNPGKGGRCGEAGMGWDGIVEEVGKVVRRMPTSYVAVPTDKQMVECTVLYICT